MARLFTAMEVERLEADLGLPQLYKFITECTGIDLLITYSSEVSQYGAILEMYNSMVQ